MTYDRAGWVTHATPMAVNSAFITDCIRSFRDGNRNAALIRYLNEIRIVGENVSVLETILIADEGTP